MLKFIIEVVIAIWSTSSLFMLIFWANAFITFYFQTGKFFVMPLGYFLYLHFCPIVHTVECFKIIRRTEKLQAQKRRV